MCSDAGDVPSCLTNQGDVSTTGCVDGYWYSQDEFSETPVTEVSESIILFFELTQITSEF